MKTDVDMIGVRSSTLLYVLVCDLYTTHDSILPIMVELYMHMIK